MFKMHLYSLRTLEKNSISFIETSALDSTNVEEAFKNILTGRKNKTQCCMWFTITNCIMSSFDILLYYDIYQLYFNTLYYFYYDKLFCNCL